MNEDRTYIFGDDDSPSHLYYTDDKVFMRIPYLSDEYLKQQYKDYKTSNQDVDGLIVFNDKPTDMILESYDRISGKSEKIRITTKGEWIDESDNEN